MRTKVYFAGAIEGDEEYVSSQYEIIECLKNGIDGELEVFSERSPDYRPFDDLSEADIFQRDYEWLKDSDFMVAEVSGESFGTGWEIAYAQKIRRIPILCLSHTSADLPQFIAGNTHSGIWVGRYEDEEEIYNHLEDFTTLLDDDEKGNVDTDLVNPPLNFKDEAPSLEVWSSSLPDHKFDFVTLLDTECQEEYWISKETTLSLSQEGINVLSDDDPQVTFKELVRLLTTSQRGVLFAEGSHPSTDLGWATCFAQWNSVQPMIYYRKGLSVSWLLIGQDKFAKRGSGNSRWLDISWKPLHFQPRGGGHFDERPNAIPIEYQNKSDLIGLISGYLDHLEFEYTSRETVQSVQGDLSSYLEDLADRASIPQSEVDGSIILAESLIRGALWPHVTVQGITTTPVSGERAILIKYLKGLDPIPSPKDYYSLIRHLINYEEKAFAKNIRALKDVGILLKQTSRAISKPDPIQRSLDEYNDFQTSLPEKRKTTYQTSLADEKLVLTDYGEDLADYLWARSSENLEKFLLKEAPSLWEEGYIRELEQNILDNKGYLLEELNSDQQERILEVVNMKFWLDD